MYLTKENNDEIPEMRFAPHKVRQKNNGRKTECEKWTKESN
jgi:hypothetical protein